MVFAHIAIFAKFAIVVKNSLCDIRDRSFRANRDYPRMSDPQENLKAWLAAKVEPHGVSKRLAAATGISVDKITRSKNLDSADQKKRRKIKEHEIEAFAKFFGELPPGYESRVEWLKGTVGDLLQGTDGPNPNDIGASQNLTTKTGRPSTPNASFPPKYERFPTAGYVPLLGQTSAGPNGRFILNGAEIGRLFVPPTLVGVEGAYGVRVYGTSMEPRYKPGETVWINPNEPVRSGDDVVVQILTDEENQRDSYIKEFRSKSSKITRLWQHNPDEGEENELVFDTNQVFSVHKIVFHANV